MGPRFSESALNFTLGTAKIIRRNRLFQSVRIRRMILMETMVSCPNYSQVPFDSKLKGLSNDTMPHPGCIKALCRVPCPKNFVPPNGTLQNSAYPIYSIHPTVFVCTVISVFLRILQVLLIGTIRLKIERAFQRYHAAPCLYLLTLQSEWPRKFLFHSN